MSHGTLILNHLKNHGKLTAADAIKYYDCYRLAARIHDLRSAGHGIETEMIHKVNFYGERVKFARYFMGEA